MPDFQIFTEQEIESLKKGGKILRECLELVSAQVQEGISTQELDRMAEEHIRSHEGAVPGFKGYKGYPATLCASVNEQCVHGIPSGRKLSNGDIITVDCGVLLDGLYTDACVTVGVGQISQEAQNLLHITENALKDAVAVVREGASIGDISSTVQKTVENGGFSVVYALTGHGLGRTLHQFPDVPNYGKAGTGPILPAHTLIAIEPIVSMGNGEITEEGDGWTISTRNSELSAHFEHTILVQKDGCTVIA